MTQWRATLASVSGGDRVHSFQSTEQLTAQLKIAGFNSVESKTETIDIQFDSVSTMFDSIRKLGATNARRDRRTGLSGRQWFQQVTDAFEDSKDSEGLLTLTYECCYFFIR